MIKCTDLLCSWHSCYVWLEFSCSSRNIPWCRILRGTIWLIILVLTSVNMIESTEHKIGLDELQRVKYGVEALVDKYNVTPLVMNYPIKISILDTKLGVLRGQSTSKVILRWCWRKEKRKSAPLIGMVSGIGNINKYITQ